MLDWLRAGSVSRLAAVVVLCTAWALPLAVPHAGDNDPFCSQVPVGVDETAAEIAASGAVSGGEHCVICHAARQLRVPIERPDRLALHLDVGRLVEPFRLHGRRAPALGCLPARAPPA